MSTDTATTAPNPRDFLNIDALLSDEELMLRDTVRRYVGDRVLPDIAEWFEQGILPRELAQEIGKLGLLGMHLDGYGCAGSSSVDYGIACMELEAGDSGLRSMVSVQGSLAMFPSRNGCHAWLQARRSVVSVSPSLTLALTPPACAPTPSATARIGF